MNCLNKRGGRKNSKSVGFRGWAGELAVRALFAVPSILLLLKSYERVIGQVLGSWAASFNQSFLQVVNFLSTIDSTAILKIGCVY